MQRRLATQLLCFTLLTAGCATLPFAKCEAPTSVHVYQAAHINEQWINFVWLEIPSTAAEGTYPGRLFAASADPVGAVVPSMIDLPCQLSSAGTTVDFAPAPVEVKFDAAGNLQTSYSWRSCSRCGQCYMVWDFTLDVQGHPSAGTLMADIVLNETFHSQPMELGSLAMPEVTKACTQPHMSCGAGGKCSDIKFERRP